MVRLTNYFGGVNTHIHTHTDVVLANLVWGSVMIINVDLIHILKECELYIPKIV